ncbi:MAG: cohesin domain-containing protein [Candidatus Paceibacterota bacterium]
MVRYIQRLLFIGLLYVFAVPFVSSAHAAILLFDPSSVSSGVGESFDVKIMVDTQGDEILGVDALLEYDPQAVTVDSISDGDFLKVGKKDFATAGKVYVAGVVEDPGTSAQGTGVLATITFTGLIDSTHELRYVCDLGETNESNISKNDLDATDIINCADNGKATIVIGGGGSDVTPAPGGGSSELPRSGIIDSLLTFAMIGGVLMLLGIGAKTISKI